MTKEQAKAELEQRFLEILDGCTIKIDKENHPDSIFFFKNDLVFFELDKSILWCRYEEVWKVCEDECGPNCYDIQDFIQKQVEKHFKIKGVTPVWINLCNCLQIEKYFQMKSGR